ncbi:MAG: hypothetical protein P1U35_12970 [Cycloclasticus sp.]|nr:hypothetical protein [Cycloclasticus sp.]
MAFVSLRDKRSRAQQLVAYEPVETPEFEEVFDAAVGQVVDEEMSISAYLNMEEFDDRKRKVKQLADDGFDINKYTSITGVIDYDRIARDTGQVKTDEELFQRRNDLLSRRRQYREEVFERGSGMAQFFGMATGFMLDPINIATLPVATAGVSLKSLGTLGAAMTVAKREAALATASELGIQAFVYQHKHDINSPYSAGDAIANIAMAATGAAVVGGITGGLSGYFGRVREAALENADIKPNSPEMMAYDQLARMEEDIAAARVDMSFYDVADDYAKVMQGEITDFVQAKNQTILKLSNQIRELDKEKRLSQLVAELGGLNEKAFAAEGFAKADVAKVKGVFGKPFFRKNGGMTLDDLAEKLFEERMIPEFDGRLAFDFIEPILREGDAANRFVDPQIEGKFRALNREIDALESATDDELELVYKDAVQRSIDTDADILREYESRLETYNEPSRKTENYVQPQPQKAAPASVTARERDILERNGWAEDYDADIQAFKNLETKQLVVDGEVVDAEQIMKELDDEIEGINSVLECALG